MKLKEAQDRNYEMLCMIDDICARENVPYTLEGGAAIGSVREKNLIPWDDDIDIKVRLENYPAFKAAMEKHLPDYCKLVEPSGFAPHFYDLVVRIIDTRFLLRKETEEDRFYHNLQNRIGIDVFLEFCIPEQPIRRKVAYYRTNLIYGLGMGHRYRIEYEKHSGIEKAAVALTSMLGKMIPAAVVCRHFYRVISRYNRRTTAWESRTWFVPESIQPTSWHTEIAYGEIRGRKFPLSAGYHNELTQFFGDYMQPPKDRSIYKQHLDTEDQYQESCDTERDAM